MTTLNASTATNASNASNIPDIKRGYEKRKQFLEDTKGLEKEEYHEIFRIVKKNAIEYSENSNGIFFDISTVPDDIFEKLLTFMELCKVQRSNEKKRISEIETIRTTQLKDSAQ